MNIPTHPKVCNLCGGKVVFQKNKKTNSGWCYHCSKCGAWVGTHKNDPTVALGTLANAETRKKRIQLHKFLDDFWKNHNEREKLYQKLADELGIEKENCHIAQFDIVMLEKAEKILIQWWRERYDK